MFLHLGRNVVVHLEDVIAIIDLNSNTRSKDTIEFIKIAEEEGFIERISDEEPKSIIIAEKVEKNRNKKRVRKSVVYFSPISSATLCKRAGFMQDISSV